MIEEKVKNITTKVSSDIKKSIYDWICVIIIIAVIAASLDMIGLVNFSTNDFWKELINFTIQWVPYFMATILLSNTLYKKGVFVGKRTESFENNNKIYGDIVNSLTGEQIKNLDIFCQEYNTNTLKTVQTDILKKEGITYEDFESTLKTYNVEKLKSLNYNKLQIKSIKRAKNIKIKGLSTNSLLSSMNIKDPTDIGKNEIELARKRNITYILTYMLSTLLMSLLAIKDISSWGWNGIILVIFKVIYTFAKSYMSYFQGYNDITVDLSNHIARKIDVLKMFINYKFNET